MAQTVPLCFNLWSSSIIDSLLIPYEQGQAEVQLLCHSYFYTHSLIHLLLKIDCSITKPEDKQKISIWNSDLQILSHRAVLFWRSYSLSSQRRCIISYFTRVWLYLMFNSSLSLQHFVCGNYMNTKAFQASLQSDSGEVQALFPYTLIKHLLMKTRV